MLKGLLLSVLLMAFSMSSLAYGEWEFSGFASLGMGRLQNEEVRYIDFTDEWSFNSDSVLGLQAQVELSDRWSMITQVVANGYDYTDNDPFTPNLEWFVLGYQIDSNTQLRFGRFRTPQYMYSTTLEVGYTYQWARPSQNAYPLFLSPFKHIDGFDFTQNMSFDDVDVGYQIFIGGTDGEYEGTIADADWSVGANVYASWSNVSARISAQQLNLSIRYPGFEELEAGYQQIGAAFSEDALLAIPESFSTTDQTVNYLSVGFSWDIDQWTLASEILNFRSTDRNFANDADGYYVSAAYQYKDVSPYIMIGKYDNRFSDDVKNKVQATENIIAPGINADLDTLRASTIAVFDLFNVEQETLTLGVRYDFHPQADLKVEVEYFHFLNSTYGNFYPDDAFAEGRDDVLTSIVIDVVF